MTTRIQIWILCLVVACNLCLKFCMPKLTCYLSRITLHNWYQDLGEIKAIILHVRAKKFVKQLQSN